MRGISRRRAGGADDTPRVQIVGPTDGWILERMTRELVERIPFCEWSEWKPHKRRRYDITYYLNYALFEHRPAEGLVGGWFTHPENERYTRIAAEMDFACSQARRYVPLLEAHCERVFHMPPGVDLDTFRPVLRLGVVGRFYGSGRKGEALLREVESLPFVDVAVTGGELAPEALPAFYNGLDYVLVPATLEGGPLALLEGLACGREIIAPDVGQVGDFEARIHRYETGSFESLRRVLEALHAKRMETRKAVLDLSWARCAERHRDAFIALHRGEADASGEADTSGEVAAEPTAPR